MLRQRYQEEKSDEGVIPRIYSSFLRHYKSPARDFDLNIVRIVVSAFFVWKLFSRDFGFYGHVPDTVFQFYPIYIYKPYDFILLLGLPVITDILTFHWVHWFVPRLDEFGLRLVQGLAIAMLCLHLLLGRGPFRVLAILSYSLLIYLWGHLFLSGQDIDSVSLYFGLLLVLLFSDHDERPLWRIGRLSRSPSNEVAGSTVSLLFLVFITYYFASGMNKFTDIRPWEWFTYDLVESMRLARVLSDVGYQKVPDFFEYIYDFKFINYFAPPLVYISHLITPMLFFYRSHVFKFFLFYALFHVVTFGVGISFTGYIPVWFVLFPFHSIIFGKHDADDLEGGSSDA